VCPLGKPAGRELVSVSLPFEVELFRDVGAAGRARNLLAERFAAELTGHELDTAKLLASELVTNAVVHGEGMITMRADLDEGRLRVEVIDQGSGFERVVQRRELSGYGGWGLMLVESESSCWGVREGMTHVWFELERPRARSGSPWSADPGEAVARGQCGRSQV
jgi:anti-sigma regulatory factor (Ser/Thr protein kinase)